MRGSRKKQIRGILITAAVILACIGIYLLMQHLENSISRVENPADSTENANSGNSNPNETSDSAADPSPEKTVLHLGDSYYSTTDKIETFLVIGTDASGNQADPAADQVYRQTYHGGMADFLALIVVNDTQSTYRILQLNRDTITIVPIIDENGEGEATGEFQLCTAHWFGGDEKMNCENTVTAVSGMLGGLPIDAYFSIGMDQITALNHEVGGVTVTLEDDLTSLDPTMQKGATLTLTDAQAELYVRSRMSVDDGENLSRMARQRIYLTALSAQVKELSREDRQFPIRLYSDLMKTATSTVTGRMMNENAGKIGTYTNSGITSFSGTTKLGSRLGDGLEHTEFTIDPDSLTEVMTQVFDLKADPDGAAYAANREDDDVEVHLNNDNTTENLIGNTTGGNSEDDAEANTPAGLLDDDAEVHLN